MKQQLNKLRYIVIFFAYFILINYSFAQDSTKKKIDTTYKPLKFIMSESKYKYLNQMTPDTITRKRLLWYPIKNFDELFNYLPGYYLKYKDVGQVNTLQFNLLDPSYTAVLRHGRPINDPWGGFDLNLLSRNEIAELELTNGFGNILYDYSNVINIIDRQMFQFRPYTEISFFQDRYENLYLDANYHQNFFRNFNFNMGITKHSYDGHYVNSDFDKWLGRFNFNFAASNKLNFFLYSNYAKIQRGLNGGIDGDTVDITNKTIMFDRTKAIVKNSDAYEIKERFDIDAGAVFLAGKISYTKLHLFETNSFTRDRDEENRPNPNGIYYKNNYQWIDYGIRLQQVFNFSLWKKVKIVSRSEGQYDYYIWNYNGLFGFTGNFKYNSYSLIENLEVNYKQLYISSYATHFVNDINDDSSYTRLAAKVNYSFQFDSLKQLNIFAEYDHWKTYVSGGIDFRIGTNMISATAYTYKQYKHFPPPQRRSDQYNVSGLNTSVKLRLYKFDLDLNYSHCFNVEKFDNKDPENYGNADISFHDVAFKNKLEYKIGLSSRFWTEYVSNPSFDSVKIPQNATLDFYIIGKIGKATFGLTLENILDRVIYNTGVYPFMDRGGLFNVISRFNITWNFSD